MKKTVLPQGANALTKIIEEFLKDWGGTEYQKATLDELKKDLSTRIDYLEETGAIAAVAASLKRRMKSKKSKEDFFMMVSDTMFQFFEGSNNGL